MAPLVLTWNRLRGPPTHTPLTAQTEIGRDAGDDPSEIALALGWSPSNFPDPIR
jgi:hypothetical protein